VLQLLAERLDGPLVWVLPRAQWAGQGLVGLAPSESACVGKRAQRAPPDLELELCLELGLQRLDLREGRITPNHRARTQLISGRQTSSTNLEKF
jgi:hypothetical protein